MLSLLSSSFRAIEFGTKTCTSEREQPEGSVGCWLLSVVVVIVVDGCCCGCVLFGVVAVVCLLVFFIFVV